ncbi:MAG TPA: thioredoxin domain-containing protein [Myxococcaceae bacterium]|nr:thioredoxin domain-containing protein [Myxococcaceae bacterium]
MRVHGPLLLVPLILAAQSCAYHHVPPTKGPADAPITIVEFVDFQGPRTGQTLQVMEELEASYPGLLRFQVRRFPQPTNENARLAAMASMAAQEGGKYWEYAKVLFLNRDHLDRASLERYAGEAGLDVARFRSALDSGRYAEAVNVDLREAARLNVVDEPTFLVGDVTLAGAHPVDSFREVIDEKLAASGRMKQP